MENFAKETVIIVHGTWASPKPDHLSWYQIPDERQENFVSRLNSALEKRDSLARCWKHCTENSEIFTWSGENAWSDRTKASMDLAAQIDELQAKGWRCHLVAHSHGGNVVAEALPQLKTQPDGSSSFSGTVTTLGTPFVDVMSPIAEKIKQQFVFQFGTILTFLIVVIVVLYLAFYAYVALITEGNWYYGLLKSLLPPVLMLTLGLLSKPIYRYVSEHNPKSRIWKAVNWFLGSRKAYFLGSRKAYEEKMDEAATSEFQLERLAILKKRSPWERYWKTTSSASVTRRFMLSIGSTKDEAWQVLYHMRSLRNPIAPKIGLVHYLMKTRKQYLEQSRRIESIHGVAFLPDSLTPRLWVIGSSIAFMILMLLPFMYIIDFMIYNNRSYAIIAGMIVLIVVILFRIAFRFDNLAMLSIFRWLEREFRAVCRMINDIVTFEVLRRIWPVLQEKAFGLEGYRYSFPALQYKPSFAGSSIYKYEDLEDTVVERALAKRDDWTKRIFGDITNALSNMGTPDLQSLLEIVETDLSLVHAAYYTDNDCIELIADWIAGKERSIEVAGTSSYTARS